MNRRLLVTAAVLAAAIGLWLVLWRPQTASIAEAEASIDAAEATNANLDAQARSLRTARDDGDDLTAEATRLADALPADALLAEIVLELHDVALSTGVEVRALQPAKPAPGAAAGVSEIGMSLTVRGGYDSTLAFVDRLGAMRRLVVVDAVDLAAPPETPDVLTGTIRARAFVRGRS